MTKKAAIYTRISKDREGQELGVQRQEQACRELADRHGLTVVAAYQDNDVSASTNSKRARPGYARLLEEARRGEFGTILSYSNSRLTRRTLEFEELIALHREHGTVIRTVVSGDQDLSTADGRNIARILAANAAAEAERTSERIKAQKRQRAERGEWHGGAAPFGYYAEGKKLHRHEAEAALVAEAVDRVLSGDSLYGIVTDWNSRGVTTRTGKHWRQTNLRSILLNRSLLGETKLGVTGWEPIIDRSAFDRLQRIFKTPSRKIVDSPGVRSTKYSLGGGIAICGSCGHRLISGSHHGAPGLKCTKVVNGPTACGSVVIHHDQLEEFVFETLAQNLRDDPNWLAALTHRDPNDEARLRELESTLENLLEKQRRLNDLYLAGVADIEYVRSNGSRISLELRAAEQQLNELHGRPHLAEALTDGLNWRSWSSDRRRNFLRVSGIRVKVHSFPRGLPRSLNGRKGESAESLRERREDLRYQVLTQRVEFVL